MKCEENDKAQAPAPEGKFTFESVQDAKSLVEQLRALADGFEAGAMRFTRKDLDMVLSPKGLIGFAVEAKGREGRMKLTLKFHWRENVQAREPEEDFLSITTGDER